MTFYTNQLTCVKSSGNTTPSGSQQTPITSEFIASSIITFILIDNGEMNETEVTDTSQYSFNYYVSIFTKFRFKLNINFCEKCALYHMT